ncbi:hypothetical protein BYT27DRAFT_7210458 [Phlegmacium glaucopus]|nr:hypothetical protein BYT27DRAFT_7210458 [Phlegmacium glaucopus]
MEKDSDMEIPLNFLQHVNFPEPKLSIKEFVTLKLPRISSEIISNKVARWFSNNPPSNSDPQILLQRSIPSPTFLTQLEDAIGQAWLDRAKSVVDWRVNDGVDCLPLWIIMFWREAERLNRIQLMWKKSMMWLSDEEVRKQRNGKTTIPLDSIQNTHELLGSLQWNGKMDYCNGTTLTSQLSYFFGTFWLSDDHINMMVEEIFLEMHKTRPKDVKYIQVASLSFTWELRSMENQLALPISERCKTLLYKYELRVKEDGLQKLYFPIHVGENHWVVGMINFKKKSIAFADSLLSMKKGPGAPIKFITSLQTWLKASFGKRFRSFGNSLEHIVQNDSYSCGIITTNTIAHAILDHPLCNNRHPAEERIKWFTHFASLYPSESASTTMTEDINMPLVAQEDLSDASNQACKAMTIVHLLNPIHPSGPTMVTGYDSDGSSDFEETFTIPLQPDTNPATSTSKSATSGVKRTRPESLTESNIESNDGYKSIMSSLSSVEEKGKAKYIKAGEAMREKFRDGTLKVEVRSIEAWKKGVLRDDPKAEFDPKDICRARHSGCGKYVRMKDPCNIGQWKDHIQACNKKNSKKPAGGTPTLFQLGWAKVTQAGKKKKKVNSNNLDSDDQESESKPKLDKVPYPGITVSDTLCVLQYLKCTGAAGGGGRLLPIIAKQLFKKLFSELSKKANRKIVVDTQIHKWKWKNDHVNHQCGIVLQSKAFKSAIQKPIPSDKNSRFINYHFQNPLLGSIYACTIGVREIVEDKNAQSSPFVCYAQGALNGQYNNEVFSGLLQAMVTKHNREECGIHSPCAYRALKEYLQMPNERTIRKKEARQPCFPMDIGPQTFELVDEHLKALDYDGPLRLSCNDTKLFATFHLYWDSKEKSYFLVGGVDGLLRVMDAENVKQAIQDAKADKATKVRVWCLTIPVPKVSPIIVATLPIPNSMDASALCILLKNIIDGLINRAISIVSYACDGIEVECAVEKLFLNLCALQHITIKSPRPGCKDTIVTDGIYRGQAICMVQDSKHALKTLRNNFFLGAQLLVLGNYPAMYLHILHIAQGNGTPLYSHDVTKVDCQDNNAAVHLFSADVLKYLADNHPDYVGEIVYLFVFGEFIDAYQNQSMQHIERIKLVLLAKYFLDSWEAFLVACGYQKDRYFISCEAADILHFIINGFIALVITHRDHVCCEGGLLIPKLVHLDIPTVTLTIKALSTYPSDADIELASQGAAEEANSLIALLGVNPDSLHHNQNPQAPSVFLPSVSSWLKDPYKMLDFDDSDLDDDLSNDDEESEAQQLQHLLDEEESSSIMRTQQVDERCLNLTSAALALAADEAAIMHQFSVIDNDELEEVLSGAYARIQEVLQLHNYSDLNFKMLINMRHHHQTKQAAMGVHTKKFKADSSHETTMHGKIICKLHETLKEAQDDVVVGTGADRGWRWTDNHAPAPGGRGGIIDNVAAPEILVGNAANAVLAAAAVAKRVDDYGIILIETTVGKEAKVSVMVGRVLALYSKTGSKNGKHSLQRGSTLELSPVDLDRFRTLQKADKQLQAAFKLSKK